MQGHFRHLHFDSISNDMKNASRQGVLTPGIEFQESRKKLFVLFWIWMPMWGVTWLTCMQMWSIQDAWRLFNKMLMFKNISFSTCETWAMAKGTSIVSTNLQQGILWNFVTFVGVSNAIVSIVTFQEGRCAT